MYCNNTRQDNIFLCVPLNTHTGVLVHIFYGQCYISTGPLGKKQYVNTLTGVFSRRASKGLRSFEKIFTGQCLLRASTEAFSEGS